MARLFDWGDWMSTKVTNAALKAACEQMLTENITYAQMDCQAAVEQALIRCGIPASECNLSGSNAHYRKMLGRWTPERLRDLLGVKEVPAGMFMFIVLPSGEPAKYQGDGYGNADHMGIYMGGGQTFNSSSSRGGVEISTKFGGKKAVPNGGWNMVGWSPWVDCGLTSEQAAALKGDANYTGGGTVAGETSAIGDTDSSAQEAPASVATAADAQSYAVVVTPDGNPVKAREQPNKTAIWKYSIPNGTRVLLLGESGEYFKVHWLGKGRWVKKDFLKIE